jgi:hypothetical protein
VHDGADSQVVRNALAGLLHQHQSGPTTTSPVMPSCTGAP